MGVCYFKICYVLRKSKVIGEFNQQQAKLVESKHKVKSFIRSYKNIISHINLKLLYVPMWWEVGSDVHGGSRIIYHLLATVSELLRLPIHRRSDGLLQIHPAYISLILLAGDEQCDDQPSRLLLHECQVSFFFIQNSYSLFFFIWWNTFLNFFGRFRVYFRRVLCCEKCPLSSAINSKSLSVSSAPTFIAARPVQRSNPLRNELPTLHYVNG